jgi:hypothetical protein
VHNHDDSKHDHAAPAANVPTEDLLKSSSPDDRYYPFAAAVIHASARCRDLVRPWIEVKGKQMRLQKEVYVFAEFLFFFAHMTERRLYGHIEEKQLEELLNYLTPAIFRASATAYFSGFPEEQMKKIADEFVERINEAHRKYTELDQKGDIIQALMLLVQLVVDEAGISQSVMTKQAEDRAAAIAQAVADELVGMKLDTLIEQIKPKQA